MLRAVTHESKIEELLGITPQHAAFWKQQSCLRSYSALPLPPVLSRIRYRIWESKIVRAGGLALKRCWGADAVLQLHCASTDPKLKRDNLSSMSMIDTSESKSRSADLKTWKFCPNKWKNGFVSLCTQRLGCYGFLHGQTSPAQKYVKWVRNAIPARRYVRMYKKSKCSH